MSAGIHVEGFSKSYGSVQAVRGLSFDVEDGELFGLIGPDGAGKTTTMRTLVTLLKPDEGSLMLGGHDVANQLREIRSIVGYMPQRFSLYPDLSIDQNLNFFADLFNVPKKELPERKARLYEFSRLEEFKDRLAGRLSGGMKQKLALSCTLIHDPKVLILDEPTTGVDPVSRNEFWNILADLKKQGVTVLVSTPYMDEALRCDRVAVMHMGSVIAQGKPLELIEEFEHDLYAVPVTAVVQSAKLIESIPEVVSVQGFGDSLHVAVRKGSDKMNIQTSISQRLGIETTLDIASPSLEDLFINLVSAEGEE
jgi:drug efflux transport system ATP-binding protein